MLKEKIAEAQTEDGSILGAEFEKEELLEEDISSLDFEEIHFRRCRFENCDFPKPPFIKFHLRDAVFSAASFRRAISRIAPFRGVSATGARLKKRVSKLTASPTVILLCKFFQNRLGRVYRQGLSDQGSGVFRGELEKAFP